MRELPMMQVNVAQHLNAPLLWSRLRIYGESSNSLSAGMAAVLRPMLLNRAAVRWCVSNPHWHPIGKAVQAVSEEGIYNHCNRIWLWHKRVLSLRPNESVSAAGSMPALTQFNDFLQNTSARPSAAHGG